MSAIVHRSTAPRLLPPATSPFELIATDHVVDEGLRRKPSSCGLLRSADCNAPRVSSESWRRLDSTARRSDKSRLVFWDSRDWIARRRTVSAFATAVASSLASRARLL